ncbi:hypothetical protein HKD37_12G033839 [Glycine soja]
MMCVSSFLPLSALLEILAYHVPNLLGGADRPIWGLTPDDRFSVKSIYDALNNSGQALPRGLVLAEQSLISVHRQPFSEVLFGSHLLGVVSSIMLMPVINGGEKASYGGVLRDANGHWINGFTRQLGRCSIMAFLECEDYLHVLCEANSVADNLASKFHHSLQGLVFYDNSLAKCKILLCFFDSESNWKMGRIWATAEDLGRNRARVLSLYRQILRGLNSPELRLGFAARLAKKAEARAMFWVGSDERSLHNIADLIDAAEYSLSFLRKGQLPPRHIN